MTPQTREFSNLPRKLAALGVLLMMVWATTVDAIDDTDLFGPPGSEFFGSKVLVLANGNYVVTDPGYDSGGVTDVGAVHLFDGRTDTIISTLTGSSEGDQVGSDALLAVGASNAVVGSAQWNDNRGAVTWIDGTTGLSGEVSATNSLVGSTSGDIVGSTFFSGFGNGIPSIKLLGNGHYAVETSGWERDGVDNVGAVTWGDGNAGVSGEISAANSLVGSSEQDFISFIRALDNGNYLVGSSNWDSGSVENVGAVAWADGDGGTVGEISAQNSLVGSQAQDRVGNAVETLRGGNYLVISSDWNGSGIPDAGAVTWGNGADGSTVGAVSPANSLVGTTANERLGTNVEVLTDGDYVVINRNWDASPSLLGVGAAAFGSKTGGLTGEMSASNSLVGVAANDGAGIAAFALTNGHYVVSMPGWDDTVNGFADAGAVIWGDGDSGIKGPVTAQNSLIGNRDGAQIGSIIGGPNITALTNGNYVINSPRWENANGDAVGASTWVDGSGPATGTVNASNSLFGSAVGDRVGFTSIALANGNYVVIDDEDSSFDLDHVTWGSGTAGAIGPVDATRSLVGGDVAAELQSVVPLTNGHYVVLSPNWENGDTDDNVGAITWGNGEDGSTVGLVDATNSLIGTQAQDRVGIGDRKETWNGNLLQTSVFFSNGALAEAGAISWIAGDQPTTGIVSSSNSLIGSSANDQLGQRSLCFTTGSPGCDTYAELPSGNVLATSPGFDDGGAQNAGAIVFLQSGAPTTGSINEANAAIGTPPGSVGAQPSNIRLTTCDKVPVGTTQNRVILLDFSDPASDPGDSRIIFVGDFEGSC